MTNAQCPAQTFKLFKHSNTQTLKLLKRLIPPPVKQYVTEVEGKVELGIWFFVVVKRQAGRPNAGMVYQCSHALQVVVLKELVIDCRGKLGCRQFLPEWHKGMSFKTQV